MSFDIGRENDIKEDENKGIDNENQNSNSKQENSIQNTIRTGPVEEKHLIEGVECSVKSTERFTVRFVNTTDKCVDVIWLDFEGQPVTYETLQPQTAWSVYTYKVSC